jgi:hypothetical protein
MIDYGSEYRLWDRDISMACVCDSLYYGPDCSLKKCRRGIDPHYIGNRIRMERKHVK